MAKVRTTTDTTRREAGGRGQVFSGNDVLIPKIGEIRDTISSRRAKLAILEDLRDAGDDNYTSYVFKKELLMKNINALQDELDLLEETWANLDEEIAKVKAQIVHHEKKLKLAKHRGTVEALIRMKKMQKAMLALVEQNDEANDD